MVIADTGFWLALLNGTDRHHRAAKAACTRLEEGLVTTWPVVAETCLTVSDEPALAYPICVSTRSGPRPAIRGAIRNRSESTASARESPAEAGCVCVPAITLCCAC